MNDEGYIKLYRKMMNWSWYKDCKTKALFIHCILEANHKNAEWQRIKIKRGSFITSYGSLAKKTGLTVKEVRTALDKLIKAKCVAKHSTSKNTIITVINYNQYQSEGKEQGKAKGKVDSKKGKVKGNMPYAQNPDDNSTSAQTLSDTGQAKGHDKGQTKGKQRATNKNEKKYIPPIREEYTTASPERLDGVGLASEKKAVVSVAEMRTFGDTVPGSNDYLACGFRRGFVNSGTIMPDDWQDIYIRFVKAGREQQNEFLDLLESGAYREKWGTID